MKLPKCAQSLFCFLDEVQIVFKVLKADGIVNMLYAYQECSKEGNSQDTENVNPITQKWWDMMADIMDVNPDNSPISIPLQEVFHLE